MAITFAEAIVRHVAPIDRLEQRTRPVSTAV
jgi:hypothetical protein